MTPPSSMFRVSPSTLVIHRANGDEFWIGSELTWSVESDPPIIIDNIALGEVRWFPCSSLEEVAPDMWKGRLWSDVGEGPAITVRPTTESDSVSAVSMGGMPAVPMPIEVIAAIHATDGVFTVPKLYAMSEDDGFVATMMLDTDVGLYVRYSGLWHLITDEDVVDGLTVNEVDAPALDLFDQFDRAGQLVHVTVMPHNGQPLEPTVDTAEEPATAPGTMTASATRAVPVLSSAQDLPGAIAQAEVDPDLRWWVERRMKALGLEEPLPWT